MDEATRTYVSQDGTCWRYRIAYEVQGHAVVWHACVWDEVKYRGVLNGRVLVEPVGDACALSNVALKLVLDRMYLRTFVQDAQLKGRALYTDGPAAPLDRLEAPPPLTERAH